MTLASLLLMGAVGMMNRVMFLAGVLLAPVFMGCAATGHDDDLDFRANDGLDLQYPGDGDIVIRAGGNDDDVDIPDTIIWDLAGGNVTRQTEPGVFTDRLSLEGNQVRENHQPVTPTLACTAVDANHPSGEVYKLVDAAGDTVLTLRGAMVFVGDVTDPGVTSPQLTFSFEGEGIYAGRSDTGDMVAHASEEIDEANPMRRLLIGALVAGECGSTGLP